MTNYKIKSNLSERQIEADVARYFGWCSSTGSTPFRLLDVDEQFTGADKKYDVGSAIYIQFKKSEGLKSTLKVAPSARSNRSSLEDVREFRERRGLAQDPTLYFQLRRKAAKALDYQHNILVDYEKPPWSRAIYVAPLFLDKDKYDHALFSSVSRFLHDPFYYQQISPLHGKFVTQCFMEFAPFLRSHISIPPHEKVSTHEHYYAYSESGCEISWHSPDLITEGPSRLSDFLGTLIDNALQHRDSMRPLSELSENISMISAELGFESESVADRQSHIEALSRVGQWLRTTHNIRQFLLLANSEELEVARSGL